MLLLALIKKSFYPAFPKNHNTFFYVVNNLSSEASNIGNPSSKSNHIAEYLINSCGFSSQKAASASKLIPKLTSIDQAHSVRHFFERQGFADNYIRKLIANCPRILSTDVDETIKPKFHALREMGFSGSELQQIVASNPSVLFNPSAIHRLEYWQKFLITGNRKDLVLVFRRNRNIICMDIKSGISPKLALLKEHGLSEANIVRILKRGHGLIMRSSESIVELLNSAKELISDPKSPMFAQLLSSLCCMRRATLEEKIEFFKGFGWSKQEVLVAFKKAPYFIHLSEENVMETMKFLVERAGYEQSQISSNPCLLMFSLKKRLKPRYYIMEIIKSKGVVTGQSLTTIMGLSEKRFVESVILPCKEQVPKIIQIYKAASSGQILI